MKIYRNGDRCPCCGARIEGKTEEWLELFSSTMYFLGLSQYDGPDPADAEAAVEDCTTCRYRVLPTSAEPCSSCGGGMANYERRTEEARGC